MNTENSKTNELYKFVFNFSHRLDVRSSNKHLALQNLSIYYMWKNKRWNKLELQTPETLQLFGSTKKLIEKKTKKNKKKTKKKRRKCVEVMC